MKRHELKMLQQQADRAAFYLSEAESAELERQNPKLLFAWRQAEAAADYLQMLFDREIASSPEEYE